MKLVKLIFALLVVTSPAFPQVSGVGQFGCNAAPITGTGWTTSTTVNTTQVLAQNIAAPEVRVTLDQGSTLTVGAISFLGDPGDGNYVTLAAWQIVDPATAPFATISLPYTLQASTNKQFLIFTAGMVNLQLKLTTAITGTATVTPYTVPACMQLPLAFQATAANLLVTNTQSGTASQNIAQVGGSSAGTAATGVLKVGIVGNAGATVDVAQGGATAATSAVQEAGVFNTTPPTLTNGQAGAVQIDANGRQFAKAYSDTTTASFHASANVASAASATDIAILPGNATNKVLVNKVTVSCTQTTAGIITLQLIKRSTADTSGTSSNMTVVPDYSSYAAGVSVPKTYTANPTTGTHSSAAWRQARPLQMTSIFSDHSSR
jgi:hypothetical protein